VLAIVMTGLAVVALASSADQGSWNGVAAGALGRSAAEVTTVSKVIDGDTIMVAGGRSIRLIGVDAPTPAQCYGPEASNHLKELLPGGAGIRLEYDLQRLDTAGRTLAYVYRAEDGLFVNVAQADGGFSREAFAPPNLTHVADLAIAVTEAETEGRGLWGACAGTSSTVAPSTSVKRSF
jgi:micrococcal nuclease